jgi:hypothetical protein
MKRYTTKYGRTLLFPLFILSVMISCQRKAVHKNHPELIGYWYHIEYPDKKRWHIDIGDNSRGTVTVYDSTGKDLEYYGENARKWRYNEKHKRLFNGNFSPYFHIDQLPAVAETQLIEQFDTIEIGETYCVINGGYYRKSN